MQFDLIMKLTLKLSKCGICDDAVHLSKIITRYDVSISHNTVFKSVCVTFCVSEIGRVYLDYKGFVGLWEIILQFIL